MESNFIKERVVVREQIIKKNLEKEKEDKRKAGTDQSASTSSYSTETPSDRVVVFEELVNENLRQDLVNVSQQVDTVCQTIADYLKVKSALKIFKSNSKDVRVQTNIGCNFYAQCQIDDASKIYICIGSDYYLLMELDEALKMIEFKEQQWTKQLNILQEKASKIKAHIKIALEALGRLYEVDRDKIINSNQNPKQ